MASMAGSYPPRATKRSARTSVHPSGATNTSRTLSCWPWSTSPAESRSTVAPVLSAVRPTCRSTRGSSQRTNLGVTTPALERSDSSTMAETASRRGATSSWQKRKKLAPSTMPIASLAAAPKPDSPRRRTKAPGNTFATRAVGSSRPPATSTSTESSG